MTETNAERIARMKQRAETLLHHIESYHEACGGTDTAVLNAWRQEREDMLWLIQQAEIVAGAKHIGWVDDEHGGVFVGICDSDLYKTKSMTPVHTLPQPACGNENQGEKK